VTILEIDASVRRVLRQGAALFDDPGAATPEARR
jgi:hypothetical protein